jgi:hypothetical protein
VCGCARATPPPRHLLCKPDIIFVFLGYPYRYVCNLLGEAPTHPTKNPPDKPEGYLAANPLGLYSGPGVYRGFTPGRVKTIVLLNFAFVNKKTPPSSFF